MSNTQVNFEVGKKYHNPMSSGYILIHNVFSFEGKDYITYSLHNKSTDSRFGFYTNSPDSHKKEVPYVKTRKVTHERWVIWFKMIDNTLTCTVEKTETTKESWESKYPRWEFLKCEKITYIETIEE